MIGRIVIATLVLFGFAAQAAAQAAGSAAPADRSPRYRAYFLADSFSLSEQKAFQAVFPKAELSGYGGGVEVLGLWRNVFARLALARMARTNGSRAFVIDGLVIPTNIDLDVEMNPLEIGAGWRQPLESTGRFVVYGGGSLLRVGYKETSMFATADENVDETFTGYAFFGGFEATLWRFVFVGLEGQYRGLSDALGQNEESIAFEFGETSLSGRAVRILAGITW